jgi:glycerophosphoryl diester phosphodiesterase
MSGRRRHPFLVHDGPTAFVHRGGSEEAPENTLEAFAAAVALGYRYLETDAHLSRDGILVAWHDERLDRLTDLRGRIAERTIAEIEAADAGYWFSADRGRTYPFRDRGVRIPRLAEVLERWPEARVNIDPKSDAAVAPLGALLGRLAAWDRVCIGSFSDRRLRRIRKLKGADACTSMGPAAVAAARLTSLTGRMPRLGADCIQVPLNRGPVPLVTPSFLRTAQRAGLPVHVWTINDEQTMNAVLDLGVDGIMTDRPRLLRAVFETRGLRIG